MVYLLSMVSINNLKYVYILYIGSICLIGPPNPENVPEDGKLKSEMMIKDNRRYYLDLKENSRGRFLRVKIYNYVVIVFSSISFTN